MYANIFICILFLFLGRGVWKLGSGLTPPLYNQIGYAGGANERHQDISRGLQMCLVVFVR